MSNESSASSSISSVNDEISGCFLSLLIAESSKVFIETLSNDSESKSESKKEKLEETESSESKNFKPQNLEDKSEK